MTDERSKTDVSSDKVIRKYFDTVYKLALSQTKNQTFAEDVTQDVFVRFIQNKDKFESEEHIKAWLIRVTINCSKSVFMSSWFKKTVPLEEDLTFDSPEKSDVYFAVQDLPLKYRTVIHLFYYEDLSTAQISQYLHVKESTVRMRLTRARNMLRRKIPYDLE